MKTFKQFILEISHGDTVYRGHEAGHEDKHIEWHSSHKDLANEYATGRKNSFIGISKAKSKNSINLGHDRLSLKPGEIIHHAIEQHDTKKFTDEHRDAADKFREHFGSKSRNVTEYWNSEENKKHTHTFLKKLGYDSIKMREGKHERETIGVLK